MSLYTESKLDRQGELEQLALSVWQVVLESRNANEHSRTEQISIYHFYPGLTIQ